MANMAVCWWFKATDTGSLLRRLCCLRGLSSKPPSVPVSGIHWGGGCYLLQHHSLWNTSYQGGWTILLCLVVTSHKTVRGAARAQPPMATNWGRCGFSVSVFIVVLLNCAFFLSYVNWVSLCFALNQFLPDSHQTLGDVLGLSNMLLLD